MDKTGKQRIVKVSYKYTDAYVEIITTSGRFNLYAFYRRQSMGTFNLTGIIINLVILSLLGLLVYRLIKKIKNRKK